MEVTWSSDQTENQCDGLTCTRAVQKSLVPPAWRMDSEPPLGISLLLFFVANRHLGSHCLVPEEVEPCLDITVADMEHSYR